MPTKFVFLILPNIHILDLAGADQAIHEAIDYNADFVVEYVGIDQNVVTTSGLAEMVISASIAVIVAKALKKALHI